MDNIKRSLKTVLLLNRNKHVETNYYIRVRGIHDCQKFIPENAELFRKKNGILLAKEKGSRFYLQKQQQQKQTGITHFN